MPQDVRAPTQLAEFLSLMRRNADFARLFWSSVVSFLGDWFAFVAVSGLVKDLTGSDGAPALVFAAEVLPIFALSPLAGVLADRWDRKRLMMTADLVRIVPALGLVAASQLGVAWMAFAGVAWISALAAFHQPVATAVVPNLVDPEDLPIAMAAMGSVWGTMLFLGAGIGGVVTALVGRDASFVIDAATFLASAVLLFGIRRPFQEGRVGPATLLGHFGELVRFVRPRKAVKALMTTKAGVGIGNGIVGLLPVFALDKFGAGDAGVGMLLAARGLGGFLGPYVGRRFITRGGREDGRRLVVTVGLSIVAYGCAYLLLPSAPNLLAAGAVIAIAHLGGGNQWVWSSHGLQLTTRDDVRGRVTTADFGLATLAIGVSALAAGALAPTLGVETTTYLLAATAIGWGLLWLLWTRDLWTGSDDPLTGSAPRCDEPAR